MGVFKPTTSKAPQSPKQMPKRGSKTLKFNPTNDVSEETITLETPSDDSLQSPNRRRRYMRRGSRAPSMFQQLTMPSLEQLIRLEQENDSREPDHTEQQQQRVQRRPSIMSLLGQQLQQEAVLDRQEHDPTDISIPTLRPLKLQRTSSVPTSE